MTAGGFGRLVEHDPRSRQFAAPRATVARSVLWGHHAPVLDQGDLGACTGFSLAQLLNTDVFAAARPGGRYLTAADAVQLYSLATRLDEFDGQYPPTDTGSSGLGVAKAGVQLGYFGAYGHAFGFAYFVSTLQTQPVIVGTDWYEGMTDARADGMVRPTGRWAGGHEYVALGVDYDAQVLTFLSSWGDQWAARGRFRMTFNDFADLIDRDGDATAPAVPVQQTPPPVASAHRDRASCCAKLRALIKGGTA